MSRSGFLGAEAAERGGELRIKREVRRAFLFWMLKKVVVSMEDTVLGFFFSFSLFVLLCVEGR